MIAFSIVVGILVGKKSWEYKQVGMLTLAVFMGIMVGFTISNIIKNSDQVVLYIILGVCSVAGYYLMNKYEAEFIIYSTAFIGSYCIVRGASIFIGDFPSETDFSSSGDKSNAFYAYLAAIIFTTIGAVRYQKRHGSGGSIFAEGGAYKNMVWSQEANPKSFKFENIFKIQDIWNQNIYWIMIL